MTANTTNAPPSLHSSSEADSGGCKAWRRANLRSLCDSEALLEMARGLPKRGASKRMAARLDLAPAALSNMIHGVKNIGDEAARHIETQLGQIIGSLDKPPFSISFDTQAAHDEAVALLSAAKAANSSTVSAALF